MAVRTDSISLNTRCNADMHDITDQIARHVTQSGFKDGIVIIFCPSATSALTTIEYESGLNCFRANHRHMAVVRDADGKALGLITLEDILEEMAQAAISAGGEVGKTFWRIPDRAEAMRFALSQARPGEVVIVCGKGHEQSMCSGEIEYAWDDRVALRAALSELLGVEGPPMPELPTKSGI